MLDNTYVSSSAQFLISALFGLYILAVLLRFLLQWVRADFHNPISQFLVKVTNPPLRPLRRIIPGVAGVDIASLVLLLALQMLELFLLSVTVGQQVSVPALIVGSIAELINLLINVYIVGILIQVILSWVNPHAYNPATSLLHRINEPVLAPARRVIPPISGIDLSPVLVLLALQLLKILIVAPLADFAGSIA